MKSNVINAIGKRALMRTVLQRINYLYKQDPLLTILPRFTDNIRAATFPASDFVRRFLKPGIS